MAGGGLAGLAFVPGGYDTTGNQVENLIANYNKNQGLAALGRYFQSLENQQLPPAALPSDFSARSASSFGPSTFGRGGQSAVDREAAAVNSGNWAPAPDYEAGLALAQPSLQNPPAGGPTLGGAPGATYSQVTGTPAPGVGAGTGPSPQLLEKYREAQAKYPRTPYRGESAGGMQPTPPPPQPGQPTVPGAPPTPGQPTGAAAFTSPPTPGAFRSQPRVSRETAAEGPPTFQSLAAAIVKANPGIDPAVLASAVQLASPLMRTDSQMWYRMLQAELRQEQLQQQLNIAQMNIAGRQGVAETYTKSREQVNRENISSRERIEGAKEQAAQTRVETQQAGQTERTGARIQSQEEIAAANRASREGIAARREESIAGRAKQNLEFKREALDRNLASKQQLQDQRIAAAQEKAKAGQASDEDIRALGKAVANYELNPATVNYRQRNAVLAEAKRVNPDWSQANWTATNQGITRFTTGPQGDAIRYLNVAENHLQTLEPLINLLATGDARSINSVINYIQKNWEGATNVTNFESARHFVAGEVSRAAIGARGALGDRAAAEEPLIATAPVQQLKGVVNTYRKLMSGQLKGLEAEWNAIPGAPKNFKQRFNVSASDLSESKDRFKGFEIIDTAPPR